MRTLGQLQRQVNSMKPGESFYLDLNISTKDMFNQVREYIQSGILVLDEASLAEISIESCRDKYRTGEWMAGEMTYIRA